MATIDDALNDTQPCILHADTDMSQCPRIQETMSSQQSALRTSGLLTLILEPNLEASFTAAALLAADNLAIFQLLPLILSAIQRIGVAPSNRHAFVALVSALRNRVVACRGLKLRFLLLVSNDSYAAHWDIRMVHRRHCYAAARKYLDELSSADASRDVVHVASTLQCKAQHKDDKDYVNLGSSITDEAMATLNTDKLIAFAATSLFHRDTGIRSRSIVFRLRTFKSAFYGADLVDGIMERSTFKDRRNAYTIAQRLLDVGIVVKAATTTRIFHDSKKSVYQCHFQMLRDDDGHCKVVTNDGFQLSSWKEVKDDSASKIKQVSVQVPMDMIDLQSFEFWTQSVYVRGVDKGYRYGYRAVTHPLYCAGISPIQGLDFSPVQDQMKVADNSSSTPNAISIIDSTSSSTTTTTTATTTNLVNGATTAAAAAGDSDELTHMDSGHSSSESSGFAPPSMSVSSASVSTHDINDLQQEAAVVGSVIIRKIFSSIARPFIIQLRVPIENGDLSEDDHHIVLNPGILVKEGDNLMQDLGVEIMFQCFNHIWNASPKLSSPSPRTPLSVSYEVFPTSTTQGFMEAVTGLVSLKEYDWTQWRNEYGTDEQAVNNMLRSAVGSYVGTYIIGGRDRHFDNVLIKDHSYLLHIDFGFILGNNPPIDGPPIAIAPAMEAVFKQLGVWTDFKTLFVDAFMALRQKAPAIVRSCILLFTKAGFNDAAIREFIQSKHSLNVYEPDERAAAYIRKQLDMSSSDIKTKFKQFSHQHIDPAWYGLLEKGFPPAVAIMKLVDARDNRTAKKLAIERKLSAAVSEDEKVQVKL